MKSYNQFLEATEADLKKMGASPSQIEMLKKRQTARGKGFSTGDDRVKTGAPAPSTPRKALPPGRSSGGMVRRAAGNVARRAANKGAAIVRQKASEKLKAMRAGTGQTRRAADSASSKRSSMVRVPGKGRGTGTYESPKGVGKKRGPGVSQGGGKLVKSPGGKIVRGTMGPAAVPSEKQAGKRPGTTRDKAAAQRERILKDKGMKNRGNLAGGAYKKVAGALNNARKKVKLRVPRTTTQLGDVDDLRGSGPKKFGRSAS